MSVSLVKATAPSSSTTRLRVTPSQVHERLVNRGRDLRFSEVLVTDLCSTVGGVSGSDGGLRRVEVHEELFNEQLLLRFEAFQRSLRDSLGNCVRR